MTGFTNNSEAAILDDPTVGLGRTLHLRLLTGTSAGQEPNDDGTLPSGMAEVSGGGYAVASVASTAWSTAAGGAPSTKQLPKSGGSAITFAASGANFGAITAYALTTDSGAYTPANVVASGPITNSSGVPISVTVNDGSSISFTDTNPIIARLGDPALVTDATTGTQRTAPI